ncbi:Copper resistance protein D [Halogranum amylolyticum]|uniref:Copper resistance protein D n=1 Tax=Halogranum amylolyticum TaxID=660520 RepID=A0A1H8MYS8_9EURY|nr:CopD family protein [Halogranum amylolyticum]SEO22413.1 Copper resistance protein D [Halogranum amylolyticum]
MAVIDAAMASAHLLFAGLWTGSVLFTSYAVLPTAASGDIDVAPLETIVGKLTTVSRASALFLLLSGGHLAGTRYTAESLFGSPRGHLVLAMVVLWFVLAALVEIGASKLRDGLDERKVRTPARDARRLFTAAAVVALLLLVDAGLLLGGVPL